MNADSHDLETEAASPRERRLAQLAAQLADRLHEKPPIDIESLVREHSDLADDLRALWATMLVTDCIAAGASSSQITTPRQAARPQTDPTCVFAPDESAVPAPAIQPSDQGGQTNRPSIIFGDYELLEELGRGGMGVVYKVRQLSLDRIVALKTILHAAVRSPADLARFRTEAESAARLDHPAIVPIYEVGEYQGRPYFTMKYVGGTTLERRLAERPMSGAEAAALLSPICDAIHDAHQRGVLHRDLKPSNVLIDEEGRPHVSDFGLAKRVEASDDLTLSGVVLGTPSYMSPEQAAGRRGTLGPASDVYSLGAVLYKMLTARPPFQAATAVETVLLVLEQDPLPPRLLNPSADPDLEMIALKCLQKPIELRYTSAKALADDLNAYLADEPTSARAGLFGQVLARAFRETHHATVLENWGLLWMWHSVVLVVACLLTSLLQWNGTTSPLPYMILWIAGLGAWAAIFWTLRRRSGPVTFVERQVAHIWASGMIAISLLFVVEIILQLPVLSLSPVLALVSGMVFVVKAGILTGKFYFQAAALFGTAIIMALLEQARVPLGIMLYGLVSAACFFLPGLKYYRQRVRGM